MRTERTNTLAELMPDLGVTLDLSVPRLDPEEDTRRRIKAARTELWHRTCPSDYKASDWDHPKLTPWRAQIDRVLGWNPHQEGKGMLLSGPTGRGKTRSLWALLKRLQCDEARDVGYWKAIDWFAALSRNLNYGRDDAAGFVRACAQRPIFAIDDLGQEAVERAREGWARAWFFDLLDTRLGEKRHTLVTTNLSAGMIAGTDDGAEIRAEPLVRRLLDLCEVVHFTTAAERAAKMTQK